MNLRKTLLALQVSLAFGGLASLASELLAATYDNSAGNSDSIFNESYTTAVGDYEDAARVVGNYSVLNGTRLTFDSEGYGAGVRVLSGGTVNLTDSVIKTSSPSGNGVIVSDVETKFSASSSTVDSHFIGVLASAGSKADLNDVTITTRGSYAHGIASDGMDSSVVANGLNITTLGSEYAYGLRAMNGAGLTASHIMIDTGGAYSHGVIAEDAGSQMTIDDADISTSGNFARGVRSSNGGVSNVENASVVTTGDGSYGLSAINNESTLAAHNVSVETFGSVLANTTASGIVSEFGASLELTGNSFVTTRGNESLGLLAQVSGNVPTTTRVSADTTTIITTGNNAIGAMACSLAAGGSSTCASPSGVAQAEAGSSAVIELSKSKINTSGKGSMGLYALGRSATLNATDTNVITAGAKANGISVVDGTSHLLRSILRAQGVEAFAASVSHGHLNVNGGALLSDSFGALQSDAASIALSDGALVKGGNGVLLEIGSDKHASLTMDGDVAAVGDIVFGSGVASQISNTDVSLSNKSEWSGSTTAVSGLSIASGSQWTMIGNSRIHQLSMDRGTVAFSAPESNGFKTLTVDGGLSGQGTFKMNTDLATLQGDMLRIKGQISGSHTLVIADSGLEPSAQGQQLRVVNGQGGSGSFSLYGDHVDAGAFRYNLAQQANDWFLVNAAALPANPDTTGSSGSSITPQTPVNQNPKNLSKGANAAVAAQSAVASIWNAQMNALVKRLGELRMGKDAGGIWSRAIGKKFSVDGGSSRAYDQNVTGLEIGADKAIAVDGGKVFLGAMIGTAHSSVDLEQGASGEVDSTMGGLYVTYIGASGYYLDGVLKYSRFDNDIKTTTNLGERVKGSYNSNGIGGDIEVGRHIDLKNGWFVEPQLEVTATKTDGGDYTASNGLRVKTDDVDSLQSRAGGLLGRNITLSNGVQIQPYVKASYVTEHAGDSNVYVNGTKLLAKQIGDRAEIGFGGIIQLSENSKLSLDAEYAKGHDLEEPFGVTLGYRYLW